LSPSVTQSPHKGFGSHEQPTSTNASHQSHLGENFRSDSSIKGAVSIEPFVVTRSPVNHVLRLRPQRTKPSDDSAVGAAQNAHLLPGQTEFATSCRALHASAMSRWILYCGGPCHSSTNDVHPNVAGDDGVPRLRLSRMDAAQAEGPGQDAYEKHAYSGKFRDELRLTPTTSGIVGRDHWRQFCLLGVCSAVRCTLQQTRQSQGWGAPTSLMH